MHRHESVGGGLTRLRRRERGAPIVPAMVGVVVRVAERGPDRADDHEDGVHQWSPCENSPNSSDPR